MNILYNISVSCYSALAAIASPFNHKAKLFHKGRKELLKEIELKIDHSHPILWFHCSSVGEFEQARPLIEWYKENRKEYKILLTFFSPSGYELRKNYPLADWIFYLPMDTASNAKKFLDIVKPQKAIFIKYEFWYNYLNQLSKRGIQTYIVSAIFRSSQPFFKPYGSLFRKMLHSFTAIFVQDEHSRTLLEGINVKENVIVCGDTRFDRVNQITASSKEFPIIETFSKGAFTILAGSSWAPDEEILASTLKEFPGVKLVIAPHEIHQEHIDKICTLMKDYRTIKFSQYRDTSVTEAKEELEKANVLIIDCLGILSSIYRYGKLAYIGGGFGVGIHNILEAATYGIPVVFGPKYQKFKEARDLIARGGAASIKNREEFHSLLEKMVTDESSREDKGKICREYVNENLGATARIIGRIENISF